MKTSKRTRIFLITLAVLLVCAAAGAVWVSDTYPAAPAALAVLSEEHDGITIERQSGRIVFSPEEIHAGLIFYPGAKVEFEAYAPLMLDLAEEGFFCVLLKMPLNLAILNVDAADRVAADFPEIGSWILAGHSMGGAAAGMFAGKHAEKLNGLVLLAAYSTSDLRSSSLDILSIYGSEDGVLNRSSYAKNWVNLPEEAEEFIISGGNHAGFGFYGPQKGDGEAMIPSETQIRLTTEKISEKY